MGEQLPCERSLSAEPLQLVTAALGAARALLILLGLTHLSREANLAKSIPLQVLLLFLLGQMLRCSALTWLGCLHVPPELPSPTHTTIGARRVGPPSPTVKDRPLHQA